MKKITDPFCNEIRTRWATMMSRCYNPHRKKYKTYGERGIKVCKEWHDIRKFANWCKTSGYKKELQLDRINNNGDYCPENCRWVTPAQNSRNRRTNINITISNKTMCVADWAKYTNRSSFTLYWWIKVYGIDYAIKRIKKDILINNKGVKNG